MKKCYYAKKCGGCAYIHEEYENQLIEKQKSVQALFPRTKVSPIVGMDNPYHYRHKVYATFGYKEDGLVHAGMYEENSHNLIFAKDCLIQHNIANHIIQMLCDIANKLHIEPYNEDTQYGVLRHAYVRVSHATNKALVVIVIGSKELPGSKTFVKELLEKEPRISSIVLNYNRKDTSLILGDTDKVLYGPGYITDTIHDIEFRISPKSFYQINPVQTEKLYSIAIELANLKKTDNVLDACCGIGTISLCAAKSVNSVTGVEISKDAIKDAIYNAKKNHINNAYFYAGDAGEFIDSLIDKPDVVFLDPPRSGMSKQAIDALIRLKTSRIVYISCNPETQARDVKQLVKEGYRINKIVPVDLFPYTKHVENVISLEIINNTRYKKDNYKKRQTYR